MKTVLRSFILLILLGFLTFPQIGQCEINGHIIDIEGDVAVNEKPAKIGDKIRYGDRVVTGKEASCIIKVSDDSIIQIKNDARMTFNISEVEKESAISLLSGWFAAILKNKHVSIHTPTAVAGIRGTIVCIKVESDVSTYTCTCNGTIDYSARGDKAVQTITAVHHKARYFLKMNDGKIVSTPGHMRYHQDSDIEALAEKIGLSINWTTTDN